MEKLRDEYVEALRGAGILLQGVGSVLKFVGRSVRDVLAGVAGLGASGFSMVSDQFLGEEEGMKGVRAGVMSIPFRLDEEIRDWLQAIRDGQFSGQMADYTRKLFTVLGSDVPRYEKFEAIFFEIFAVMYFASKPLMLLDPLFYLMPNLIYAFPILNGLDFYNSGDPDLVRRMKVLTSIAAVINRRLANGEKRDAIIEELVMLLGDFRMISDPEALQRRLENVLAGLYR